MADRRREVQELREQATRIDTEIRDQLDARARVSRQIHALIEAEPSADGGERDWLDRLVQGSSGDMPAASLRAIFRQIRASARAIEQSVRVAVAGPEAGFCHETCLEVFGATTPTIECATVPEALSEVARGRAAFAIFPFESSQDGLAQSSLMALSDTELVMVGERFASCTYHLMSVGTDAAALEKVYSTAVAHAACQRFLDQELPRVTIIDVRWPKVAAELAHESATGAALVSESCGSRAELSILRQNVGDEPDLRVRYGIVAQRPAARTGNDVSCILFSTENKPGSLYDTLRHFSERGINLRKLQSLPVRRDGFDYYFYVEISGHASDRSVVTAFEAVKRSVHYFRLLGSFPAAS
jgi:chorismate mutase/prephenate dehydratase